MYIIGVVLIDYRRSDGERVTHVIGISDAKRRVHGIVNDLEKVRVRVGWQRVKRMDIFPMAVIVGISPPITRTSKMTRDPIHAKQILEVVTPLLAVGVAYTVITRIKP